MALNDNKFYWFTSESQLCSKWGGFWLFAVLVFATFVCHVQAAQSVNMERPEIALKRDFNCKSIRRVQEQVFNLQSVAQMGSYLEFDKELRNKYELKYGVSKLNQSKVINLFSENLEMALI